MAQPTVPNSFVVFLLSGAHTAACVDADALYPKIDIVNCGDFYGHFRGAIADVLISRCRVNVMLNDDGGPLRGKLVLDNCAIRANAIDENSPLCALDSVLGTTFHNCTVHAPVLDGVARPDALSRYGFIAVKRIAAPYPHSDSAGPGAARCLGDFGPVRRARVSGDITDCGNGLGS